MPSPATIVSVLREAPVVKLCRGAALDRRQAATEHRPGVTHGR